ncbi:MAG: MBOAT family protein [Alsobacter sp.]
MLFNSQLFLLAFLPFALLVHLFARPHRQAWIVCIIALSLAFYSYWDVRLLPVLLASILLNWFVAQRFQASGKRAWLTLGIVANLLSLGVFKYTNFLLDNLAWLSGWSRTPLVLALPLGISFFTFQQVAYLVDLRRGVAQPHGLARYALYVSFFPHLIAGPLLRHSEFFSSLDEPRDRTAEARLFGMGLALLAIGLVKKVMIADPIGFAVDQLFSAAATTPLGLQGGWLAGLGFSIQIYFDFSGYSDIAIGVGYLFGIVIPTNFDAPYRTTSISDFWRRWHMTLSRLLRDYVYKSFGGNRHGFSRQMASLLATMLIGGLWHGAGWNFVIWGGLHGLALVVNHLWRRSGLPCPVLLGWAATFLFVVATFVVFRAADVRTALNIWSGMAGLNGWGGLPPLQEGGWRPPLFGSVAAETSLLVALATLAAIVGPTSQAMTQRMRPSLAAALLIGLALLAATIAVGGGGGTEFVYFQF